MVQACAPGLCQATAAKEAKAVPEKNWRQGDQARRRRQRATSERLPAPAVAVPSSVVRPGCLARVSCHWADLPRPGPRQARAVSPVGSPTSKHSGLASVATPRQRVVASQVVDQDRQTVVAALAALEEEPDEPELRRKVAAPEAAAAAPKVAPVATSLPGHQHQDSETS